MAVKSNVSRLFTAGNRAARMRRSTSAALAVDQLQLDQPQQIARMIDPVARRIRAPTLSYSRRTVGSFSCLR